MKNPTKRAVCENCGNEPTQRVGNQLLCRGCAFDAYDALPEQSCAYREPSDDDVLAALREGCKTLPGIRMRVKAPRSWFEASLRRLRAAGRVTRCLDGRVLLAEHAVTAAP